MKGKKVLHLDRNDYYGGECASLSLSQLYKRFRPGMNPPASFGKDKEYNVDLIPKFMMADEELVRILVHTDVTRYLEFRQIAGSFVLKDKRVIRVPAGPEDISFKDILFGPFEMLRIRSFFQYVDAFDTTCSPDTLKVSSSFNPFTQNTSELYSKFSLGASAQEMIGHAVALYNDDSYLGKPAIEAIERMQLYKRSALRFGKSPYIYPSYGLSELPQGFARLSALYGGTYMLEKPFDGLEFDPNTGRVVGVRSGSETISCSAVIGDPSYFPERVSCVAKVVRAICLLQHPIPSTSGADSAQIIIPRGQVGRKFDIYVACTSSAHSISPLGMHVAIVSTVVETEYPELELRPGLELLGSICEKFVQIYPICHPLGDGQSDGIFISKSLDASSHFQGLYRDVARLWERITGESLDAVPQRERVEE